ncbi:MAG TPA: thiamine pyrophosphate-dependent dehydrogenase E1 component subunit alpha [Chloroflexota bacterium]
MAETLVERRAGPTEPAGLSTDQLLRMYRTMVTVRVFDSEVLRLFREGRFKGSTHPYNGQEAVAVGACAALTDRDYITSTHRGHGHCIAKGADLKLMMAEIMGRATGYCKGKGGSMHICDFSKGNLGANGIVGAGIGIAGGAALACKIRNDGRVALSFFSDGANNQGLLHETANMAAIWKLPLILLCENNHYAMSMRVSESTAVPDIAIRAAAYGIPGVVVDGQDVLAVYEVVREARERALAGEGPTLIEAKTWRWEAHSGVSRGFYKIEDERYAWKKFDPIVRFKQQLLERGVLTEALADQIQAEVEAEVAEAIRFAEESPEPDLSELTTDVFAN